MASLDQIIDTILAHPRFSGQTFDAQTFIASLDEETLEQLFREIQEEEERERYSLFARMFPDDGPYRRALYPRHTELFSAGATYMERLFMAGNRVGKTRAGAYESTCHLTGQYPDWWDGRIFTSPIAAWVAGDTNETTRDILQKELLGEVTWGEDGRKTMDGSGMIPRDCIGRISWKRGVDDLVDKCLIKHRTGRWSNLAFKSYDQGRRVFQGTAKHLIWLDEECPMDVYGECLIRLATTRGLMLSTFTPLKGLSEVVLSYMPEDMRPAA